MDENRSSSVSMSHVKSNGLLKLFYFTFIVSDGDNRDPPAFEASLAAQVHQDNEAKTVSRVSRDLRVRPVIAVSPARGVSLVQPVNSDPPDPRAYVVNQVRASLMLLVN